MTGRNHSITLGILALAVAAAPALALEPGLYFELSVGKSTFKDVDQGSLEAATRNFFESYDLPVQSLSSTLDDTDGSYAITTGYRLNRYLAGEVSYFRLGASQYFGQGIVSDAGVNLPASLWVGYRTKGIAIGGAATLPVGRYLEFRARGGISNTDTRVKFTANVDGDELSDKSSGNSQDFYYGAGVGLNFWTYYRIGVDFTKYDGMGKASTTGDTDIDNVQLSFSYQY
jgi:hypothetical protein